MTGSQRQDEERGMAQDFELKVVLLYLRKK